MVINLLYVLKIIILCINFNICIVYLKRRIKVCIIIICGFLMITNIWILNNIIFNEGDNFVKFVYFVMVIIYMEVFVYGYYFYSFFGILLIKIKC